MATSKKSKAPAGAVPDYIFGYGSLIEFASRTRTAPDALYVRPARVSGFVRGWFAMSASPGYSPTYLGATTPDKVRNTPAIPAINGVLYYVTPDELKATDQRENAGYTRVPVQPKNIKMLDGSSAVPAGNFWIYLNKFSAKQVANDFAPNANFPIVQSYVDICVNGCMEIESNFPSASGFLSDFFATTVFWNEFWVNDRPMPRRPFIYRSNAYAIDAALAKYVPGPFSKMRIEPASWEAGPQMK